MSTATPNVADALKSGEYLGHFPIYEEVRQERGNVFVEDGIVHVLGYAECLEMFRDSGRFSARVSPFPDWIEALIPAVFGIINRRDGKLHSEMRRLMNPALNAGRIEPLRSPLAALLDRICDSSADKGPQAIASAVTGPFTQQVIAEMLGVEVDDQYAIFQLMAGLKPFLQGGIHSVAPRDLASAMGAYARLTKSASNELLDGDHTDLLDAIRDMPVKHQAKVGTFLVTLAGGYETTDASMRNSVAALWTHQNVLNEVVSRVNSGDPRPLLADVVWELLRFNGSTQRKSRVATEDTWLGGVFIKKGQPVSGWIGAADMDTRVFNEPWKLKPSRYGHLILGRGRRDVDRRTVEPLPLTFGAGAHKCPGLLLALAELEVFISRIGRFAPAMEFANMKSEVSERFSVVSNLEIYVGPGQEQNATMETPKHAPDMTSLGWSLVA